MSSCSKSCQHPTHTPLSLISVHTGLTPICTSLPEVFHWPPESTLLASIAGQTCRELTTHCPPAILDQWSAGVGVYIPQLLCALGGITLGGMFYTPGVPRWNESPVSHNSNYIDCFFLPFLPSPLPYSYFLGRAHFTNKLLVLKALS